MAMSDFATLAREHARQLRNGVLQQEGGSAALDKGLLVGLAVFLDDAADEIERLSKALATALIEALNKDFGWYADSSRERRTQYMQKFWLKQADHLLASGVIERKKRLPTREEIIATLLENGKRQGALDYSVPPLDSEADAVLALFEEGEKDG